MAFPGPLSTIDNANRSDGAAHAGAGATIWQNLDLEGEASSLIVSSNALGTSSSDHGALTVNTDEDFLWTFDITGEGGYFAFYYGLQDAGTSGWTGYWVLVNGLTWTIRKRTTPGSGNTVIGTVDVGSSLSSGEKLAVRRFEGTHELYVFRGGEWQAALITTTDTDVTGAGEKCLLFGGTGIRVDNVQSADPSLGTPDGPFTILVDADHPDASDDYDRVTATDPDTPLLTIQRACELAYATPDWGDTILVSPADAANPADEVDPRMYETVDFGRFSASTIPFNDNSANMPITIRGDRTGDFTRGVADTDGVQPIWRGWNSLSLKNWVIEQFQVGYDTGTEDDDGNRLDTLGVTSQQRPEDLVCREIHFTSGAFNIEYWTGTIEVDSCTINAPLSQYRGGSGNFFDGRGFGFSSQAGDTLGGNNAGTVWLHDSDLIGIRGNDAVQAGLGDVANTGAHLLIEDCLFWNVTENGPGGDENFHTDSTQLLGGYEVTIRRSVYIGCTNAFIASDYENQRITMENCLVYGGGGQFQCQGTHEVNIWHCTFLGSFFPESAVLFYKARQVPVSMVLTFVNNIVTGLNIEGDTDVHEDSLIAGNLVITDPGGTTTWGDHLAGVPELGISARIADLPDTTLEGYVPTGAYELANVPITSPGIGQGVEIEGLPTHDRLGRAFTSPPDVGCHQSDPGTLVTAVARPPYIIARSPSSGQQSVATNTDVTVTLFPKPGETIDAGTVSTSSAYVTDSAGATLPAVVSVGAANEDGEQIITVNLKSNLSPLLEGTLYPLVLYTVHLTGAIEDSEGSALSATTWNFRAAGPAGAAVYGPTGPGSQEPFTAVTASDRTTNGCTVTFNSSVMSLNSVGMKQLQGFFDRLTMDTAGDETGNSSASIVIEPLE